MILPAGENLKKMKTGPVDRMNVEARGKLTSRKQPKKTLVDGVQSSSMAVESEIRQTV